MRKVILETGREKNWISTLDRYSKIRYSKCNQYSDYIYCIFFISNNIERLTCGRLFVFLTAEKRKFLQICCFKPGSPFQILNISNFHNHFYSQSSTSI